VVLYLYEEPLVEVLRNKLEWFWFWFQFFKKKFRMVLVSHWLKACSSHAKKLSQSTLPFFEE
jgi:hypothetical protein